MSDVFTKSKRSEVMSRIRGRGNKDTELVLARILRSERIAGWRRHTALMGRPDFAFPRVRLAVFVDGCFWHGCPKHSTTPANNRAFWMKKLNSNRTRDRVVNRGLKNAGWRVLRIWEHDLLEPAKVMARIRRALAMERPKLTPEVTSELPRRASAR